MSSLGIKFYLGRYLCLAGDFWAPIFEYSKMSSHSCGQNSSWSIINEPENQKIIETFLKLYNQTITILKKNAVEFVY